MAERVGGLEVKVDGLDEKVDRNYFKVEEFYVYQKEFNTMVSDRFGLMYYYSAHLEKASVTEQAAQ